MDSHANSKVRLYQVWKGHNKFICGGRLIFGPDASSVAITASLVGVPGIIFCTKMFLNLPKTSPEYGYSVLIVGIVLLVLDLIFLILTSGTNPGIVPRSSRPPESGTSSTISMDWLSTSTSGRRVPRTRDEIVNGQIVRVKFCQTCLIYRPPRTSHCSVCNNCVLKFDHHCPWVGQCIGIRNYPFYIIFITSSTMLCIYVFTFTLIHILHQEGRFWTAMSRDILSFLILVYCFISVWFVGGLSVFHFYLMCTNQTTYENFRYRYDKTRNPYNRGILNNLKETIFAKIPPSLVDFREVVYEDESLCTESIRSKEKKDVETEGVLGKYHSNNVYPTSNSVNIPGVNNSTKGKEDAGVRSGTGPVLSPLFSEPRLRKCNSFNGESSTDNTRSEDIMFHRVSSSYH
ncbi:S-acyltransferase [Heracleum sosnowskyi]|uniref:S-acyltransferase n=1 Tax=Heracleum sosnowskyi TaxID=360622 RepID=A0AAD8ILT8_9APIA|nr:S-acyltransferase [Heracleum sosnowskyi]